MGKQGIKAQTKSLR